MSCIICNKTIQPEDRIWQCSSCYQLYHLKCIKTYAQSQIQLKHARTLLDSDSDDESDNNIWNCKACKCPFSEIPYNYYCFCGKVRDPEYDPWLKPHTCGNLCEKNLPCGHTCNDLCHEGPCPPCARTERISCYCGRHSSVLRCGSSSYSCNEKCGKLLSCGYHYCQEICHEGECPACKEQRIGHCYCGKKEGLIPCTQNSFSCQQICNQLLSCGKHHCTLICHPGICPDCPNKPPRKCYCGKETFNIPCDAPMPSCHNICGKILSCGVPTHTCPYTCHPPPCPPCHEVQLVKCRCGLCEGKVKCGEEFLCNTKCNTLFPCGKHICKKRCCIDKHDHCPEICGKKLDCKLHTCILPCHPGACPSCALTVTLTCYCKRTSITVPCKDRLITPYPKCTYNCEKVSRCHHKKIQDHLCHFGQCPDCSLLCEKPLKCGHLCQSICHDLPNATPCPECHIPVQIECMGHHQLMDVPCCHKDEPISCSQPCGHLLACHNHYCTLPCHLITDIDPIYGTPCEICNKPCEKIRKCSHPCSLGRCHEGECPACIIPIKVYCQCGKTSSTVLCKDIDIHKQTCCNNICKKPLPFCPHLCNHKCHCGSCMSINVNDKITIDTINANINENYRIENYPCEEKVKVICKCGKKKEIWNCKQILEFVNKNTNDLLINKYKCMNDKFIALECDESCKRISSASSGDKNTNIDQSEKEKCKNVSDHSSYSQFAILFFISIIVAIISYIAFINQNKQV